MVLRPVKQRTYLGYHIDISNERLLTKMHEMRHARELRLQKILQKIAALGYCVEVAECDPDNRAVGRPHVAKALVAKVFCYGAGSL